MEKRSFKALVAVLAAVAIACGSTGAGSAGQAGQEGGGGTAYLTADTNYGVGAPVDAGWTDGGMNDTLGGATLQP